MEIETNGCWVTLNNDYEVVDFELKFLKFI